MAAINVKWYSVKVGEVYTIYLGSQPPFKGKVTKLTSEKLTIDDQTIGPIQVDRAGEPRILQEGS